MSSVLKIAVLCGILLFGSVVSAASSADAATDHGAAEITACQDCPDMDDRQLNGKVCSSGICSVSMLVYPDMAASDFLGRTGAMDAVIVPALYGRTGSPDPYPPKKLNS